MQLHPPKNLSNGLPQKQNLSQKPALFPLCFLTHPETCSVFLTFSLSPGNSSVFFLFLFSSLPLALSSLWKTLTLSVFFLVNPQKTSLLLLLSFPFSSLQELLSVSLPLSSPPENILTATPSPPHTTASPHSTACLS